MVAEPNSLPQPAASPALTIRAVKPEDLDALCALENASFAHDRLSRRRLRHWILAQNRVFLVVTADAELVGYGLVLLHRGTRLARLYSIAIAASARGRGVGRRLMAALEEATQTRGRLYMRLEVAEDNHEAVILYRKLGYVTFGRYEDYYDDHQPALRMQKRIRYVPKNLNHLDVPWYRQTTDFTCGPAAAMMAMTALAPGMGFSRELELDIWREATTIFMTSGHGGCHPVGLALALERRGFEARVYLSSKQPLFVDGVRSPDKKDTVRLVHHQFVRKAEARGVQIHYAAVTQTQITDWINAGSMVVALISTYRMDRRKAPHWVTISAADDACLYIHDPDPTEGDQLPMDCQYLPLSRDSFDRMAQFGRDRLTAFLVVSQTTATAPPPADRLAHE